MKIRLGSKPFAFWLLIALLAGDAFLLTFEPGGRSLDARLWYSTADVYQLLDSLGTAGRGHYLIHEAIDFFFISAYTLFILNLATLYLRTFGKSLSGWLLFFCLLPGLFDCLENLGIISLVLLYPSVRLRFALATSLFTTLKWLSAFPIPVALYITPRLPRSSRSQPEY